jgi:CRP-like cAMP-binding protein
MADLIQALAKNHGFRKIPVSELETLVSNSIYRRLNDREYLCIQDDVYPYVILIVSGKLRWVMLSATGKEHQLFMIEPGSVFWSHSFFDDQPMPASLVASKSTDVYLWHRDVILPSLYRYPDALFDVTKKLTATMRRAREIIYGLAFQPVAGRLASFILSSLEDSPDPSLERDMTLEDIASVCATSPEVVCRLLYQFQDDGLINITRTHITLQDLDTLKQWVNDI